MKNTPPIISLEFLRSEKNIPLKFQNMKSVFTLLENNFKSLALELAEWNVQNNLEVTKITKFEIYGPENVRIETTDPVIIYFSEAAKIMKNLQNSLTEKFK